jgi:hypothetical protein
MLETNKGSTGQSSFERSVLTIQVPSIPSRPFYLECRSWRVISNPPSNRIWSFGICGEDTMLFQKAGTGQRGRLNGLDGRVDQSLLRVPIIYTR